MKDRPGLSMMFVFDVAFMYIQLLPSKHLRNLSDESFPVLEAKIDNRSKIKTRTGDVNVHKYKDERHKVL